MSKLLIDGSPQPPKVQGVAPPARLEVSEFVKNDKYFSLYIQALRKYPSLSPHLAIAYTLLSRNYLQQAFLGRRVVVPNWRDSRSELHLE